MNRLKLTNRFSGSRPPLLFSCILLLTLLISIPFVPLHAQLNGKAKLDSLLLELPKAKEDTNKVILLRKLAVAYREENFDQAMVYARQSLELAEKLKDNHVISSMYYFVGNLYLNHADFINGLECLQKALKIEQVGGDKEAMASILNNIAVAYINMSDHAKAIDANLKALKLFEDVKNRYGMANCHLNISSVYNTINKVDKALEHVEAALKIYTELSDKHGIALALNNIGGMQMKTKDSVIAKDAFVKALAMYEEIEDFEGIDMAMINLAESYIKTMDYSKALEYAFKALQVAKSHDMTEGVAFDYKAIGEIYYSMATEGHANKQHSKSLTDKSTALRLAGNYTDSALVIYEKLGMLQEYADAAELSAKINFESGNYKEAYEKYALFKSLNDSVFNIEKDKKITQSAMQYDFDKKEAAMKAEQEKKNIRQRNIRNSIIVGLAGCLVFLVVVYRQRNRISREKARSEELLLNILPEEVAEELKEKGSADAKHFAEVTVMFTDFKGFTQISEKLTPAELVEEIHTCFKAFDQIITKYDIEKIKTIGDAYMCAGGLPVTNTTNAIDVVRAALEIQQFMQQHLAQRQLAQKEPFEIRIGIHTGPVVAGIVGVKKFAYDIWGDTVNTASRMESSGEAGKVNISGSTYAIVKDTFDCTYRGKVHAKGKGDVDMYFVNGLKIMLFLLLFFSLKVQAIEPDLKKIDSLQTRLNGKLHDTMRAKIYFEIADEYWNYIEDRTRQQHNFELSKQYATKCLRLSEKCDYPRGIADAYHVLAGVSEDEGKSMDAIVLRKKALNYYKDIGDQKKIGKCLYSLGISYNSVGDKEHALQYYFEGVSCLEKMNDSSDIAGIYHNIGMIYYETGNKREAINYIKKARSINEKREAAKTWLGTNCLMLGNLMSNDLVVYNEEALHYYQQARNVFQGLDDQEKTGMALVGMGSMLSQSGKFSEGVDTMYKALTIFQKINNTNGIAWTYNNLGWNYTIHKKFREAAVCLDSCLRLCRLLGAVAMRNAYQRLYQLDSVSGNLGMAYIHYRSYIHLRDSLNSSDNIQTVARQQLRAEYAKKEEREKNEREKKEALQRVIRNSILVGLIGSFAFLIVVYRQRNRIKAVNAKNEELLLNILPEEVAEELRAKGEAEAKLIEEVTVLFTDFKDFTQFSEKLSPKELVAEINACFKAFDHIMQKHGIEKIKTIGDAYMAAGGLPVPNKTHAEDVVKAAIEIQEFMQMLKAEREKQGKLFFEIRIGIHTGPVVAGIVGVKKFAYDIWGDTVNTASRIESSGEAGKINISGSTYAMVKDTFNCSYRGKVNAKGKGEVDMYFVEGLRG